MLELTCITIFLVLAYAKLSGKAEMSWWIVFSPMIILLLLYMVLVGLPLLMVIIGALAVTNGVAI